MIDSKVLISVLWSPFLEEIRKGGPVYFCFYRDMLTSLFNKHRIEGDPIEILNSCARSCLIVGTDVELKPEVLHPQIDGRSSAIILVAQQVLAVEEMVRDRSGLSDNAYFPRLRNLISSDLQHSRSNPFSSFDEFEKIWRTLANEVRAIQGSSDRSITFRFGEEEGVDKARSFPFSQALLTREDLNTLAIKIGLDFLRKSDPGGLWARIRSEKSMLRRRSQRLLGLTFLRERIIDQVRAFAKSVDDQTIISENTKASKLKSFEIRFYKDSVDWLTDEFRAYLISEGGERSDDEELIRDVLKREIGTRGFFILPPGDLGDSWSKSPFDAEIQSGDTFLIVGTDSEIARAWKIIKTFYQELEVRCNKVDFPFLGEIFVQQIVWPSEVLGTIKIRNGSIVEKLGQDKTTLGRWIGGFSVDSRGEKFLLNALPRKATFGDETYDIGSIVSINGAKIDFAYFESSLAELKEDQTYEVEFPGRKKIRLGIAIARGDSTDRMGHSIDDSGKISPILDRINEASQALVGYRHQTEISSTSFSPIHCAMILRDLRFRENPQTLSESDIKYIIAGVKSAAIPDEAKLSILKLIEGEKSLSKMVQLEIGLGA